MEDENHHIIVKEVDGKIVSSCTICGSIRFAKDMKKICDLRMLIKKIDLNDGIYVVNIDGYVGESVKKEIN